MNKEKAKIDASESKQRNLRFVSDAVSTGYIVTSRLKVILVAKAVDSLVVRQVGIKKFVLIANVRRAKKPIYVSTKRRGHKPRIFMSTEVVKRFIERNLGLRGKLLIEFSIDVKSRSFS